MRVPFETDDGLARRIRAVAVQLRRRDAAEGAGVLGALAIELEDVAMILDPERLSERTGGNAAMVQPRLPFV